MSEDRFSLFFRRATGGQKPEPYQERLALCESLPSLVDVPTGLGKTSAAVLAWVWRRRFADVAIRAATPRRLIYCLPMRVLVEQTHRVTVGWLRKLGLSDELLEQQEQPWSAQESDLGNTPIHVHSLLGGAEASDWALWPERDAILVGTQDMLLSRALNRGYAAGRARWPLEFGLLNNDCFWVFDEIQLMDTSLATSLQLDAWRRSLRLRRSRTAFSEPVSDLVARPCPSLWMSATMTRHWLESAVDWSPRTEAEWNRRHHLLGSERNDSALRSGKLFQNQKRLAKSPISKLAKPKTKENRPDKVDADRKQAEYLGSLAEDISQHRAASGLTLVIVNTVERATRLFELVRRQSAIAGIPVNLVHSRFRPIEREGWASFLQDKSDSPRIVISTQVVEAGVDLSARKLYTELAPWAALVQRFGRCARYPDESGDVTWLDFDLGTDKQPSDHWARPYERGELAEARTRIESLTDVGLSSLAKIKAAVDADPNSAPARALFPYEPRFVPRSKDLFDLFDTTPDLTGADVDISRFIRDGEELDVQVFWRDVQEAEQPAKRLHPQRNELCPVPFHRFRDALVGLRKGGPIWRRDYRAGWVPVDSRDSDRVYPGQVFLLERSCGGYSRELGWTGEVGHTGFELPAMLESTVAATSQDDQEDADDLSETWQWLTVLEHTRDVCRKLDTLDLAGLTESEVVVLRLAARWHDRGKAHAAFQAKLKPERLCGADAQGRLVGEPAAKGPDDAWRRDKIRLQAADVPQAQRDRRRPGFRHELASALAILETLRGSYATHEAFSWPDGVNRSDFGAELAGTPSTHGRDELTDELVGLSADELDLLVYLVAAHHGKVRMSLRSSPDDDRADAPDRCPPDARQARGVRDGDSLRACRIPGANLDGPGILAPEVTLSLDMMELGLSPDFGASWRERMQFLLERLGPFRLGYLEALLRAADCRASADEGRVPTTAAAESV